MIMKQWILLGIAAIGCFTVPAKGAQQPPHLEALQAVAAQYRREITVLEISTTLPVYLPYVSCSHVVGVALVIGTDPTTFTLDKVPQMGLRWCLMMPPQITITHIERMAECEHFDLVIVHDLSSLFSEQYSRLIAALRSLGDQVCLLATTHDYQEALMRLGLQSHSSSNSSSTLFIARNAKKYLQRARYTQRTSPGTDAYEVRSTVLTKMFHKKGSPYPLRWIPGINLVTFFIFQGVYPDEGALRLQLEQFKELYDDHNDLVYGNLILQGTRLIPIDRQDARRNAGASECLSVGLRFLSPGNFRLIDTQRWMQSYNDALPH